MRLAGSTSVDLGSIESDLAGALASIGLIETDLASALLAIGALESSNTAILAAISALQGTAPTIETVPSIVLGNAPTYATYKDFALDVGTSRVLTGVLLLTGGSAAAPTSGGVAFGGTSVVHARRTSAGVVTVGGAPATQGTVSSLQAQWVVSGANARLEIRATGGPTVQGVFIYNWLAGAPPS